MATKKELEAQLHQYEHSFEDFKQQVVAELESRDAREHEMLQRIYPYLANEIDQLRAENKRLENGA